MDYRLPEYFLYTRISCIVILLLMFLLYLIFVKTFKIYVHKRIVLETTTELINDLKFIYILQKLMNTASIFFLSQVYFYFFAMIVVS